jgi:ElaB/YqjD/DUF883 family membrane-anchored ribosome-binding protein
MTETTTAPNTETDAKPNESLLETATATAQSAAKTATTTAQDAAKTVAETSSSLFTQAKDAIGQAVETTIEAVKEHPVAAAAIGAGVAATVAGAAIGVSKLLSDEEETTATGKTKSKA